VQADAPARANDPAAHGAQPDAAAVPLPVTAPENPAAQMVQAVTAVLPVCEPVVETPVAQGVHAAAPALLA